MWVDGLKKSITFDWVWQEQKSLIKLTLGVCLVGGMGN